MVNLLKRGKEEVIMVCYKHCYHKKPCAGCLKSDHGNQSIAKSAVNVNTDRKIKRKPRVNVF